LIFHSPAKLNLYLYIKQKYQNGFHEIDSLFVRINLYDVLTISDAPGPNITRNGDLSYLKKDDLCYKAAIALKQTSNCNLGCSVTLRKRIPIGAGLGGGSSNAATVLKGLNKLWKLRYTKEELKLIAKEIGADVPFFIEEANCFGTGIGESLTAISNSEFLPKYYVTLTPNIKISTALIFEKFQLTKEHLARPKISEKEKVKILSLQKPFFTFGCNDLESTAVNLFPEISRYLQGMKNIAEKIGVPAESCRMSGSGSTIFCGLPTKEKALNFKNMLCVNFKKYLNEKKLVIHVSELFN
tara:strand:- start:3005 stop:3898 length:894 start_codon:yes stop_codon:yes gene_type:complete